MFLSIAILISIAISQKIDDIMKNYEDKVRTNAKELEDLNQSLEKKVKEEIEKNKKLKITRKKIKTCFSRILFKYACIVVF